MVVGLLVSVQVAAVDVASPGPLPRPRLPDWREEGWEGRREGGVGRSGRAERCSPDPRSVYLHARCPLCLSRHILRWKMNLSMPTSNTCAPGDVVRCTLFATRLRPHTRRVFIVYTTSPSQLSQPRPPRLEGLHPRVAHTFSLFSFPYFSFLSFRFHTCRVMIK